MNSVVYLLSGLDLLREYKYWLYGTEYGHLRNVVRPSNNSGDS